MGFSLFIEFVKVIIYNNPKLLLESSGGSESSWRSAIIFTLLLTIWPLVALLVALGIKIRTLTEDLKEKERLKAIEEEEKIKEIFGSLYDYEEFIEELEEIQGLPEKNMLELRYKQLRQANFILKLEAKYGEGFVEKVQDRL